MFSRRDGRTGRGRTGGELLPAIDPRNVGGLVLDFNLQNVGSYTVTGGNTVTSITNTVSAVAASEVTNPPAYEAAGLNGFPCMKGNGTSSRLIWSEAAVSGAGGLASVGELVVFSVVKWDASALSALISTARSDSDGTTSFRAFGRGATAIYSLFERTAAGALNTESGGTIQTSATEVVCHRLSGGAWSLFVNGALVASDAHGTAAVDHASLRCSLFCKADLTPDSFSDARLGRKLVYGAASNLTVRQIIGITKFLKAQWGIA
jgi:hypothetical protein